MQGFYYLLALIAFGVIAGWFAQNDRQQPGEPTKGLLRMKSPAERIVDQTREGGTRKTR